MQEIHISITPVVTGICGASKSGAQHHHNIYLEKILPGQKHQSVFYFLH